MREDKVNMRHFPPTEVFKGGNEKDLWIGKYIYDRKSKELKIYIIDNEIDVNKIVTPRGETYLYYAAILGHIEEMRVLLELGANPNIISPSTSSKPMDYAVYKGDKEMLDILLKYGARLKYTIGDNPVNSALYNNDIYLADYLIRKGADVNHNNYKSAYPLDKYYGISWELIDYLLSKGANPKQGTFLYQIQESLNELAVNERGKVNGQYKNFLFSLINRLEKENGIHFPLKEYIPPYIINAREQIKYYKDLPKNDKEIVDKYMDGEIVNQQYKQMIKNYEKDRLEHPEKFKALNFTLNKIRTINGKTYTEQEWKKFEQEQFELYAKKHNISLEEKPKKGGRFFLDENEFKN